MNTRGGWQWQNQGGGTEKKQDLNLDLAQRVRDLIMATYLSSERYFKAMTSYLRTTGCGDRQMHPTTAGWNWKEGMNVRR
jgi:hypothetical protein